PAGTPANFNGVPIAGVLGFGSTTVLFGNDNVDNDWRSGLRVRAGFWFDECQTCGLEGSYFFLAPSVKHVAFDCFSSPVLARPFVDVFDTANGVPLAVPRGNAELVCLPGELNGTVAVDTRTQLYGFDVNVRKNLMCTCDYR